MALLSISIQFKDFWVNLWKEIHAGKRVEMEKKKFILKSQSMDKKEFEY